MADPGRRTPPDVTLSVKELVARKAQDRIVVCIPARNEEATVGAVVATVARAHLAQRGGSGLVDQVLVVDDGSSDATASRARAAGADVTVRTGRSGKGQAMRDGVAHTASELVVFLDADVVDTTGAFVSELVRPLLVDPGTALVKGFYSRPLGNAPTGGGRVTELVARPVLRLLFPELRGIRQPLAGETAVRRSVLEKVSLDDDYGVEMGLLIDVAATCGPAAIAQVDLGIRTHRNRPLTELAPQAEQVLAAALRRAGISPPDGTC